MIEKVRRIVGGETPEGKSVFTHVEEVEPLVMGGRKCHLVWGWDTPPSLPYDDTTPYEPRSAYPDPTGNGMRLFVNTLPPESEADQSSTGESDTADLKEWLRLQQAEPCGFRMDPKTKMHTTDGLHIGIVLSGELVCEHSDNEEVLLRPGDFYIQNGAEHAWHNRSDQPCVVASIVLSAGPE